MEFILKLFEVFIGQLWYLFLNLLAVLRLSFIDLLKSPHGWGALPNYSLYIDTILNIYKLYKFFMRYQHDKMKKVHIYILFDICCCCFWLCKRLKCRRKKKRAKRMAKYLWLYFEKKNYKVLLKLLQRLQVC